MSKKFVKYPVMAAQDGEVLRSDDGLFTLVKESSVGIRNTPWTGLRVKSSKAAERFVVEVRLMSTGGKFDGTPVEYKYYNAYVSHGMSGQHENLEDTEEYIKVLQSAVKFARECEQWIEDNGYSAK